VSAARLAPSATAAVAFTWMGAAFVFLLLQVVVMALSSVLGVVLHFGLDTSARTAWTAGIALAVVLEIAGVAWIARRTGVWRPAGHDDDDGPAPLGESPEDTDLLAFERAMLVGAGLVAVVSLVINGQRPGWSVAIGVTEALGAFLLGVGTLAASIHDRHLHARAAFAVIVLAASAWWSFHHR
jgi:hypothetical protein